MYLVSQYIPLSDAEAQAIAHHDGKNERNYYVIHSQIRIDMMIAKQQVFDLIKDLPDELDIDESCIDSTSGKNLKLLRKMSEKGGLFRMKKSSGRLLNGSKNKVDNTSA